MFPHQFGRFFPLVTHLPGENSILSNFSSPRSVAILGCESHSQAGSAIPDPGVSGVRSMGPGVPNYIQHLFAADYEIGYMKQRAAIFSNWKVIVDGKEVATMAPSFETNKFGYARGLTDAGMLGDNAFYMSTGGWKYDNPYNP